MPTVVAPSEDGWLWIELGPLATQCCAWMGSWEQCFADVATVLEDGSVAGLLNSVPCLNACFGKAAADMRAQGVRRYKPNWPACLLESPAKRQKLWSRR